MGVSGEASDKTGALAAKVLGDFEIRDVENRLVAVGARKSRALLAALALAPGHSSPRDRVARLLWSDRADEQARSSLRQALANLRRDLAAAGASPVVATESRIRLDPALIEVDVVSFQRLAASADSEALRAAAQLYRGELLADVEIRDSAFQDWLETERRRLADLAAQVFEKLWAQEAGQTRIDAARRLVALDPLRESAHRKLMQAYAEAGERTLALRQFEKCRDMLRSEFGAPPADETTALRETIGSGAVGGGDALAARHQAGPAEEPGGPSVAVLPFDAMAGEADLQAFSDGLTEDITTSLSRIKAIRVVARSTMSLHKGRPADIRRLGRDLGARYVLAGSVRKLGAQLRISAELIEAASGHHVWARRIDRASADMVELNDEIASSIVASVQTQLILNEGRAAGAGPESAANLLARSWQLFLSLTEPSLAASKGLAERALALDGSRGMAHRMIAVSIYHQVYMGYASWTEAALDDIYSHARLSMEAEDADEYSHWAMECAYLLRKDHARALASLQRALDINPHCSLARGSIGTVLSWSGKSDVAIESNEQALRMNPDDPTNFFRHLGLALAHYLASRYEQARLSSISVLQARPQWWLGLIFNAASAAQLQRPEEAHRALDELRRVRPGMICASLSILPFATADDGEHLLAGLRKAGLRDVA